MKYLHLAALFAVLALFGLVKAFNRPEIVWIPDIALLSLVLSCICGMLHFRAKAAGCKLHPEAESLFNSDAWSEHPQFPRDAWREEAAENYTQLGYWEWVSHKLENRDSFTQVA